MQFIRTKTEVYHKNFAHCTLSHKKTVYKKPILNTVRCFQTIFKLEISHTKKYMTISSLAMNLIFKGNNKLIRNQDRVLYTGMRPLEQKRKQFCKRYLKLSELFVSCCILKVYRFSESNDNHCKLA